MKWMERKKMKGMQDMKIMEMIRNGNQQNSFY